MRLVIDANILIAALLKDAPYLALSLALKIPIWSNDTAFKKQSLAKIYTTAELLKFLSP